MAKKPQSGKVAAQKNMTLAERLASLPPERAQAVTAVRKTILANLRPGYEEAVLKNGTIAWQVPLSRYPDTYNKQALWLAALASPKSYLSLHLLPVYMNPVLLKTLEDGFRKAGKRLDMGKGCIHFQKADDLALDVIGRIIASLPVDNWVAIAESARRR